MIIMEEKTCVSSKDNLVEKRNLAGHHKHFSLPSKSKTNDVAVKYLIGRGIDKEIIDYCVSNGFIYESIYYPWLFNAKTNTYFKSKKGHRNVVFVGYKPNGKPGFASWHSTTGPKKGIIPGSRKEYSFQLIGDKGNPNVHIFKSELDLLSYATLLKRRGLAWDKQNFVTVGGPYVPDKKNPKLPISMKSYFAIHPTVKEDPLLRNMGEEFQKEAPKKTRERVVYLYFDNTKYGRRTSKVVTELLEKTTHYTVMDIVARMNFNSKDLNSYLLSEIKKESNAG